MTQKTQYLHELLATLNAHELRSLANMGLKGKEKDLFDLYVSYIGKPAPSKEHIGTQLSMSSSHIDKTNSIVLKKCYEVLTSNGMALWDLFRHKHLPRHLYHDFLLRERELKKANDISALAKFYLDAFETIHQLPYQDYDPSEGERFKNSYFELTPDVSNNDRIMIEGRYIRQTITNGLTTSKGLNGLKYLGKKLEELERLIDISVEPLPKVQFYLAGAQYYKVVEPDEPKQRTYLSHSINIVNEYPDVFAPEDPILLPLKVADTYFQESKFAEAYQRYCQVVPSAKDLIRTQFFHLTTYAQLSTLCKAFEDTDAIIKEFFSPYSDGSNWQVQAMADITLAKRYLYSGDITKAKKHIDSGFLKNDKGVLISFDLELRKLETLYFALSGDFNFTEDLIAKHIKFLHSKKISVKESLHGKFFKVMRDIINELTTSKKLSKTSEELLIEQSSSFQAIYGLLLQELRRKH